MRQLMLRMWQDDSGALIATEWVFVATILVLSLVVGLKAVESAVEGELIDFANALVALNQSYSFSGQSNCESSTAGSAFSDGVDSIMVASTPATLGGKNNSACD